MKKYRIATIQGDGIGKEVVPEGMRVLDAVGKKAGIQLGWEQFPWSCAYHKETGRMMPENGLEQIRHHDAIFLGAVTDGDKKYTVRGTAVDNDFDGTIRMGKNEFLLSAKRSK